MINREALCAALALVFTFTVVIPSILIFGDRSLPFQYIDAAMVDQVAVPGQRVHVRYTVAKVSKDCSGTVQRYFFDGAGRVFFLGEAPAVYYRVVSDPVAGTFEMPWVVPLEAAPGDGLYVAYVEFWCNKVQALFPIKAPPQKARVTVLMPNRASGN